MKTGTELWVLRHAPTPWNEERRFQGRTDIPLGENGRREASAWKLPSTTTPPLIFSSPLARARETAEILYPGQPILLDDRLVEMCMGEWEGRLMTEARARDAKPWPGLDYAPPGGETLRQGMERVRPWLLEVADRRMPLAVAIAHKGLIHALYALATGWQGDEKPNPRPRFPRLHRFHLGTGGLLTISELNILLH